MERKNEPRGWALLADTHCQLFHDKTEGTKSHESAPSRRAEDAFLYLWKTGTSLKKYKGARSRKLCDSVLFKAAGQMWLLSYSACCPQQRWISLAFVLSNARTLSPTNSVSPQMLRSPSSEACGSCYPHSHTQKGSAKSQDYVFSAFWAHAVRISSVNNRPFSHGLFRISDETAEMSMRGGSHQSESGSVTLLFSVWLLLSSGGWGGCRKPPCLLLDLFYDLGCC